MTTSNNTLKQLAKRFPYMFSGRNIGICIARGWRSIFAGLCEQIDATLGEVKMGFHWVQCKEKFGSARFYWDADLSAPVRLNLMGADGVLSLQAPTHAAAQTVPQDPKLVLERVDALVCAAESQTQTVCLICGQRPAQHHQKRGYVLVLCEEHARMRQQGDSLRPFDDEDCLP